jgi:hypothetical protein
MSANRTSKTAARAESKARSTAAPSKRAPAGGDPTSDEALLALGPDYAAAPDIPVDTQAREIASLARLARAQQAKLTAIGITPDKVETLARFGRRLLALERAWHKARGAVKLTPAQKKLVNEAEVLDTKLVAGGRWGCRGDEAAQTELTRIAEGSGLVDTLQDLRDLVTFWTHHEAHLGATKITAKDLARATALAHALDEASATEASDVGAATAIDLRNRAFWSGDELAKEIREGGRYAFSDQPKIAAKFVSRHRASANRRSRRKTKAAKATKEPVG